MNKQDKDILTAYLVTIAGVVLTLSIGLKIYKNRFENGKED